MSPRSRSARRTGLAVVALACALTLAGCSSVKRANPAQSAGELPDEEVTDFVLRETDQGHPQWTLYAKWAASYAARDIWVARDVRLDFFDEKDGHRSSELTAREGEIQKQTRNMTARGNVVLQTAEGTRMTTEELHFENNNQQITSDKLVRVEREGDVLTGVGFTGDRDLRHFEFKSRVNATVRAKQGALTDQGKAKP